MRKKNNYSNLFQILDPNLNIFPTKFQLLVVKVKKVFKIFSLHGIFHIDLKRVRTLFYYFFVSIRKSNFFLEEII